jgi:hypothetical protein
MADNKPEKPTDLDPFIIEKTFPQPEAILSTVHPAVSDIAKDCLFTLDANALLVPFNVGADSFSDIEKVLRQKVKEDRLYVPAQSVREYARHRSKKVADVHDYLKNLLQLLDGLPTKIQTPMFENTPEYKSASDTATKLREEIRTYRKQLNALIERVENWNANDAVSVLYAALFSGKVVHHGLTEEQVKKDSEHRAKHQLPPGYKDASKADGGIGDLIIWQTILKLGSDKKRNVVFVTNEKKPDWRVNAKADSLFPRYELVEEFFRASGKHFSMMSFGEFLATSGADAETVEEVAVANLNRLVIEEAKVELLDTSHDQLAKLPEVISLPLRRIRELVAHVLGSRDPGLGLDGRVLVQTAINLIEGYRSTTQLHQYARLVMAEVCHHLVELRKADDAIRISPYRDALSLFWIACENVLRALEPIYLSTIAVLRDG